MTNIAVIMTSHNRREKTLQCLRSLHASAVGVQNLTYQVFLVDDGSTDGTAEAVTAIGLSVNVIEGRGDLFWNRGMVQAWSAALSHDEAFDGYLLLNDDTVLDQHALEHLLAVDAAYRCEAIVVGAVRDPHTGEGTYGGVIRLSRWHPGRVERLPPSDRVQTADTFNANCVYVPSSVADAVGILDSSYQHSMGDFDYGFRARKRGFGVIVAPGTVGTCARNATPGTWLDVTLPLKRRLTLLESPKGLPRHEWRVFLRRHGAPAAAILAWVPTLRVVLSSFRERAARTRRG